MILTSKQVKDVNEVFFSIKIASIFNKDATHRFLDRGRDFELINYKRNYEKYITLDWDSVLSSDNDLSFIRNKIVLMGYMGTDLRTKNTEDNFFTPLNDKYVGKTLPDMYGVVIHANVISMIMEGDFLYFIPEWLTIVLTALIIFLTMCFLDLYRRRYEMWYEPASVFIIIIEAAFLFWGVVLCFHWFGLDLRLNKIIFAILIIVPVFELYQDSLKPIALSMKDRVVGLISRKVPTEEKPVEENKTSDSDTEL